MKQVVMLPANLLSLQRQLSRATHAIRQLTASGFSVERIELTGFTRPTITVLYNGYCRKKQERGEAVRYAHGIDELGRYTKYQTQIENCRISWEVR